MAHALVVGAGIAGDTLALLMERDGWTVTVAEIAPTLRTGGQTVDLRGDSREVLQRAGLLQQALNRLVPQRGAAWIDAHERRLAEMPVEAFDGRGYVSREELLRTDLARIIHEATGPGVTHRFGETVKALQDTETGVLAHFRSGTQKKFDLVVGADGAHSTVRTLRFGPEETYRKPLGLAHAWFTLTERPETPPLDGWFLTHNAPGRRAVEARPGHPGHQEVGLTFATDTLPHDTTAKPNTPLLERTFADVGWRTAEFLAAARHADDFALDTFDQIHTPRWSTGRIVLLGDSAWCASPLSGLGTALALRGAAELAAALHAAGAPDDTSRTPAALTAFEQTMRPRTTSAQQLLPGRVASMAPKSALGIRINALAMRALQSKAARPLIRKALADSEHGRTTTPHGRTPNEPGHLTGDSPLTTPIHDGKNPGTA